jgi:hypothetical protein
MKESLREREMTSIQSVDERESRETDGESE